MQKSSVNAFLTDSEAVKSLAAFLALVYGTLFTDKIPPEIGVPAIVTIATGYGVVRQWGKNALSKAEAAKAAPGLDEQELLEAKDEMKGILKALKEKGQ